MNRRSFVKKSTLILSSGLLTGLLPQRALARECTFTPHLLGEYPEDANITLSSTGQFHHFHYLHVPQEILLSPPRDGWTTLSSMMMPELGIDPFFFRSREVRKQFHCHQVYFSLRQLESIAAGEETTVTAYIGGRRPNHTFVFNSRQASFTQEQQRISDLADRRRLRKNRDFCDEDRHGGVSVFNSRGRRVVVSQRELDDLKNY